MSKPWRSHREATEEMLQRDPELAAELKAATPVPANAMRVAPGTDAVVWRICPDHGGEL